MPTMTQLLHDNRQAGETLSEVAHRLANDDETLTQAQHRIINDDGTVDIDTIVVTFENVTASGMKVVWTGQSDVDVGNYKVTVVENGVGAITGSPFTMAGSTLSKTLSGLSASTQYDVNVEALDQFGGSITDTDNSQSTTA